MRKPWIATNRLKSEGGAWKGSEEARRDELLKAIKAGASIVDIELASPAIDEIVPQIKSSAKCLISHHDLTGTSPHVHLQQVIEDALANGADMCKVVTTARSAEDNLNVLELIQEFRNAQIIAFAMGSQGQLSRILCPFFGSRFTYAAVSEGRESADGQLSVAQMHRLYETLKS
jgi:3-dehydroquinate dehydratase-1